MNHLTEDQFVEHYYREDLDHAANTAHLAECAACATAYATLQQDLDGVEAIEPPAIDEGYGAVVWHSVVDSLPPYHKPRSSWLRLDWRRGLAYAAGCALLAASAFYAGRMWDHNKNSARTHTPAAPAQSKVVLVVIGDHLDRTERLLIELKHAGDDSDLAHPLRDEARRLLTSNEVCRQSATQLGDSALAAALGRLEALLADVANHPDSLRPADLTPLHDEKDIENLLFEVRVLRSRMPEQPTPAAIHPAGGVI